MTSRLPSNLNPQLFEAELGSYYDDYLDRYCFDYGGLQFVVENKLPFKIQIGEGFYDKDIEGRRRIISLLRVATFIYRQTRSWPKLTAEWAEMCPGGFLAIDVTSLVPDRLLRSELPKVVTLLDNQISNILNSKYTEFADAEKYYSEDLQGLAAFSSLTCRAQKDFDENPLCTLNSNTKTRRLKFVAVVTQMARSPSNSVRLTNSLLNWAIAHEKHLAAHIDTKGVIQAKFGRSSATPYLSLAREFGIIAPVGKGLAITNVGLSLCLLPSEENAFSLTREERIFFFFEILLRDRDYMSPLFNLLEEKSIKKSTIREEFPAKYENHIKSLREHCGTRRSRGMIDEALDRISRWRSAATYMEHVVDPRISWLVDLGLCELKGDIVSLTPAGNEIVKSFWIGNNSHSEKEVILSKSILRDRFLKIFGRLFLHSPEPPRKENVPPSEMATLLDGYCELLRRNTQSLAPNRIVASTLFRYAGIMLLTQHRIAADFSDLYNFFSNELTASLCGWRLRWLPAQDDGYLTPIL